MGELSEQVNMLRIIRSRFFIIGKGKRKYGKVEARINSGLLDSKGGNWCVFPV